MAETGMTKNLDKKTQEEIEAIKGDVQDIVRRMGALRQDALKELYHQSGNLLSNFHEMKQKVGGQCDNSMHYMSECVQKNPLKCLAYGIGFGALVMMLLKK